MIHYRKTGPRSAPAFKTWRRRWATLGRYGSSRTPAAVRDADDGPPGRRMPARRGSAARCWPAPCRAGQPPRRPRGSRPAARPPDALESAAVGDWTVTGADLVLGDDDGVLFVPAARARELFTVAETIRDTERHQAEQIRTGVPLRSQLRFDRYLARRQQTPSLTFRDYPRAPGGATEGFRT